MVPQPGPDDGVGGLLDKAEVMLSLAGEPTTPTEYLLHAQTAAMIGLLKALSPTVRRAAIANDPDLLRNLPPDLVLIATRYSMSPIDLIETMRMVEQRIPDWRDKKIPAIKEIRTITGYTLADAKGLIDFCVYAPKWW